MLKNYFKIAYRNLLRSKVFNTVNILGLAAGLASFIIILLYLNYELSYDANGATVITQGLAHKLFGNQDPIGQQIKIFNAVTGTVTAVMQQPETPTSFNAQVLMRDVYQKQNKHWQNFSYQTYIKLKQPVAQAKLENSINRLYYNERIKKPNTTYEAYAKADPKNYLYTDALPDIHNFPKHGDSNFKTVSILLILAILLLIAGTINFSNLAIAKSIGRAKEVGVRKVLGSGKKQLVLQFITETFLQCSISLAIACLVVFLSLRFINQSFNLSLSFWHQNNLTTVILQIAFCLLVVILLSGLYPAVVVSRFNTVKVLKGNFTTGKRSMLFRNSLIVMQFMVSAFFVIAVLVIKSQMQFMETKDKGFSADQVMRIQAPQKIREQGFVNVQNTLSSIAGVGLISKTTSVPGDEKELADTSTYAFKYEGKEYRMASVKISTDYFNTLKIALKQGRFFNSSYTDQNTRSAVINETAFLKIHDSNLLGKTITFAGCDSVPVKVVGVVKDFNVQGFESAVLPVVYTIGNNACMYQSGGGILVKLNSNHIKKTIADIERAWKKIDPDLPIRYSFLDDNFQQLFQSYSRLQSLITFFALIAIVISAMGLFALTAFFTKQRTKEIGVRKVLGATVTQLATLLSKEFVLLVIVSVLTISPIAWLAMNKWLQTFQYRINIEWWIFVAAGILVMLIAITTISFQAIKAALANPVKSLRSE
ncbi:MAG: ABC transporter permease [Sphingobacteriaceae bacterium]|nr:MAG: ABC transporter permease [Sphingobacteriaceae bacterium]